MKTSDNIENKQYIALSPPGDGAPLGAPRARVAGCADR